MADPARRRATYDDLLAVPDNLVGEILDGELVTSPRPSPPHAIATSVLGGDLNGSYQRGRGGPGGWWILDEPELHLHGDALVPDIAGWRRERMPKLPETAAFELAPDWVCETLSPSTERIDRAKKLRIYAREGVRHVWLVNPHERFFEVLRLAGDLYAIVGTWADDERVRAEPFEAVEIDLLALWGEDRPA